MARWECVLSIFLVVCLPAAGRTSRLMFSLHAITLADDDGTRPAQITETQIREWVKHANRVWRASGISFELEGRPQFLRNSLLNGMMGETDANWNQARQAANQVAARYPGRVVVLFRHGPGPEPTRHSFSWMDVNFIVMGGFEGNSACGRENLDLLAHELGHYLGLAHPFNRTFATREDAEEHFLARGGKAEMFDNDGLTDTPPTPFVRALQCTGDAVMSLGGTSFPIPRDNVMSYYHRAKPAGMVSRLTPQQIAWARRVGELRIRGGGPLPSNGIDRDGVEFETLEEIGSHGVLREPLLEGERWSAGRAVFCRSVKGGWLTVPIVVPDAGKYRLELYGVLGPDFGNFRVFLDGKLLKSDVRGWAPLVMPSGPIRVGSSKLGAGRHQLKFEVTSKEESSRGYNLGLDRILLARN